MYEILFNSLQFPVAPEKIKLSVKNQNQTMNLISGQEINIPKLPGLTEISFELLLPAVKYPFAVYPDGFRSPDFYTNALKKLKTDKKPFRFKVNRQLPSGGVTFDTDIMVLLEDYSWSDDVGQGFDIVADIKLKSYVEYGAIFVNVVENTASGVPAMVAEQKRESKEPAKSYAVKRGDTLWAICKRELNDGSKWGDVAKLNGIANPNQIVPGQVIRFG